MTRFFLLLFLFFVPSVLFAQEKHGGFTLDEKISLRTAGGIWFWGDVMFLHDYRIQENALTKHFRLLDGEARLRGIGSFEECKQKLDEIQIEEGLLPMTGSVVILLHGFGSNALTMRNYAEGFREYKIDGKPIYDHVFNMAYPSTMQSILDHAKMLERVINNLPPTIRRIDFVGHSLGSIVMRRYLSGPLDAEWQVPSEPEEREQARRNFCPDKRVGRFVMLGPPNHGAEIATKLIGRDPVRRYFTGPSGDELGTQWAETEKTLGIPCCPFIVLAGGRGDGEGFSTLIPGDDDGIVSIQGTGLAGAEAWIQFLEVGHNELLWTKAVFDTAVKFLTEERTRP